LLLLLLLLLYLILCFCSRTYWGFKFTITPLRVRLDDAAALKQRNPALAYWLLELLLGEPSSLRALCGHNGGALVGLAETLLWFVTRSGKAARQRDRVS
jgi:hypothetical protein